MARRRVHVRPVPVLRDDWGKRTVRRREILFPGPAGALHPDRRDAEHQLAQVRTPRRIVAHPLARPALGGTTLTIRKFQKQFFTADELVRIGTMTTDVLATLHSAIETDMNILIS